MMQFQNLRGDYITLAEYRYQHAFLPGRASLCRRLMTETGILALGEVENNILARVPADRGGATG
jgi:hypothetical protein